MTEFINCPQCGERNEAARGYCWVCSRKLESDRPTQTPSISRVAVQKPNHSLASRLMMIAGVLLIASGSLIAGFELLMVILLSITCPGGDNTLSSSGQQMLVVSFWLGVGGVLLVGLAKWERSNS